MTQAYRSKSPILKIYNKRKAAEMILDEDKIHRIRLCSNAICILAHVYSPNCIWFKLRNSITEELRYVKPSPLKQFQPVETGNALLHQYVMAPIQENVYARARIIAQRFIKSHGTLVKVHFIDDGFAEWVSLECLAVMERMLFTHPWQAFPVALFKCTPGLDLETLEENVQWSEEITQALLNILNEYVFFRVTPIPSSDRENSNNYYEYLRADVFGLASEEDPVGESIAHRLSLATFTSLSGKVKRIDYLHRSWYDAKQQPLIPQTNDELAEEDALTIPAWCCRFPTEFDAEVIRQRTLKTDHAVTAAMMMHSAGDETDEGLASEEDSSAAAAAADNRDKSQKLKHLHNHNNNNNNNNNSSKAGDETNALLDDHADWDPDCANGVYPKVQGVTLSYLVRKQYCDEKKTISLCIQWESLKSPYEFYAFPVLMSTREGKDPLRHFYDEQAKWAKTLDFFYGHHYNRKIIDAEIVMRMLRDESHPQVYAIYEFNDESTISSYRRVHVLAVRDVRAMDYSEEFCRIRFLDIGGSEIVPLASLITIHSRHCKKPPMSLQLSLGGIAPPESSLTWQDKSCRVFRKLARTDMPMECKFLRKVPSNIRNAYNDPPQTWPDVFEVCQLRIRDASATVEEEMLASKCAIKTPLPA